MAAVEEGTKLLLLFSGIDFAGKLKVFPTTVGVGVGVAEGDFAFKDCLRRYTVKTTSWRITSKSHVITEPLSVILIMPS